MIKLKISFFKKRIYFKNKPSFLDFFTFNDFIQCESTRKIKGFKRFKKYTKIIDLSDNKEKILLSFRKNTRYDIRKSETNLNQFNANANVEDFVKFYNEFATIKNLSTLNGEFFKKQLKSKKVIITSLAVKGELIAMHSYLIDKKIKRVRLWYSASSFRSFNKEDHDKRNLIARTNKNLHFKDMIYFKEKGYLKYDFGGYAFKSNKPDLIGINNFKDQFNGVLKEESNYISYFANCIKLMKKSLFN